MYPYDKQAAKEWVLDLTMDLRKIRDQIIHDDGSRRIILIARFSEVNETRIRVIDGWDLREFAARVN